MNFFVLWTHLIFGMKRLRGKSGLVRGTVLALGGVYTFLVSESKAKLAVRD